MAFENIAAFTHPIQPLTNSGNSLRLLNHLVRNTLHFLQDSSLNFLSVQNVIDGVKKVDPSIGWLALVSGCQLRSRWINHSWDNPLSFLGHGPTPDSVTFVGFENFRKNIVRLFYSLELFWNTRFRATRPTTENPQGWSFIIAARWYIKFCVNCEIMKKLKVALKGILTIV